MKSIVTFGFEVHNRNSSQVSRKEADVEGDATEVPSSAWMETIREIHGRIRSRADSSRPEGCSNCYMTWRRLRYLDLAFALLAHFIFGFGTYLDVLPARSLYILRPCLAPCTSYPAFSPRVPRTLLVSLWSSIHSFDCPREKAVA